MCNPATAVLALGALSIVTSAATGIIQYVGQRQQADAQAQYQAALMQARNQEIQDNMALANESFLQQSQQLHLRDQQEDESASQDIQKVQIEAAKARATARVAAGEAGVSGLSVDSLLADFYRQEDVFRESVRRNRQLGRLQTKEDIKGLRAQAQGRVASVRPYTPEPIVRPNFLGTGLQILTDTAIRGSSLADRFRRP
jgi:hypothetical protein